MAEPIELEIGQVWETHGGALEILAIGPEYVAFRRGHFAFEVDTVNHFQAVARCASLIRPKHELWVNVYRCQYDGSSHTLNKHSSRESAERGCRQYDGTPDPSRIACLKIVFEEGEGL